MRNYLDLMQRIVDNGHHHSDRTGVGRISLYGEMLRFNMQDGFPLVTTRKIPYKAIVKELLWFITGSTSNQKLLDQNVKIWDSWAVKEHHIDEFLNTYPNMNSEIKTHLKVGLTELRLESIGPMYGHSWRMAPGSDVSPFLPDVDESNVASDKLVKYRAEWEEYLREHDDVKTEDWSEFLKACHYSHVDQLQNLIIGLKQRPYSSRHIVTAWIPSLVPFEHLSPQHNVIIDRGALAACHTMFQCFVIPPDEHHNVPRLSMMLTQRSCDFPVGAVFNIAQYSMLLHMLAQVCGYEAYEFIYSLGDVHIYKDQLHLVQEQLNRHPGKLPHLWLTPDITDIYKFTVDDIVVHEYEALDPISYPVAV